MLEVLSRGVGPATTIDRFLGVGNRVDPADRRVFEEIRRAQIGPRSIYMIAPQHSARVLRLLEGLPVTDSRGMKPIQWKGALTPVLTDERDGGRVKLHLRWQNGEGQLLQTASVPFVVYEDFPPMVLIGNSIYRAPERMLGETFRRLLQEGDVDFEVGELTQSVSRLESLLQELQQPADWLPKRLQQPAAESNKFRLVLSFAAPNLRADATVHTGTFSFPLNGNEDPPEMIWLPADPPLWATRVPRDRLAEREAMQTLRDTGFVCREGNTWEISGDDALDLVRRELAPLLGKFEIFWVAAPKPNMFRQDALKSAVQVQATPRSDWFDVAVTFESGNANVPIADVIDQVEGGKRFIQLSDGTYAEATPALRQAVRVLKSLLEDKASQGVAQLPAQAVGDIQGLLEVADRVDMPSVIERYLAPLRDNSEIEELGPPKDFNATLRDYQLGGLSWMAFLFARKLGGILADDMGLGKTVQTLALLSHLQLKHGRKPSLVVCPTSVVENWVRETHRFVPGFVVHRVDGPHRDQFFQDAQNADVLVTSYALLRRDFEKLKGIEFRYAILDEAQAIKNPQSQTAQCAKKLNADARIALTGTPIENRLSELWSIFDFCSPDLFGTLSDFRERYLVPIERYNDEVRLQRLRRAVKPFILRREKEVVAKELPPKTITQVFCDVPKITQQLYSTIAERARDHLQNVLKQKGFERSTISILTELLRLRQTACDPALLNGVTVPKGAESPKVGPFLDLVEEALESGRKILVFSQFVSMLNILSEKLTEKKTDHLLLTGQTRRRQALVDKFQADDGPRVFLISLKAGGSGLNLTAADTVIHFDPWWNPAVEEQATDRAHRIGQTKPVFVYELVARGTVEEKILKLKERKRLLAEGVLGVDGALSKLLSEDEVMALFDSEEWADDED